MKIGDPVSVVDENIQGKITAMHGEHVTLEDEHGFSYHYKKEQLVKNEAYIYENIAVVKKPEPKKIISKKHNKNPMVLDLHFDKIAGANAPTDSFERLFIQKEKLISTLEFCRKHRLKRLEIIHGIGDGVLQNLVTEVLQAQTGLSFYNSGLLHHQSGSVMVEFV